MTQLPIHVHKSNSTSSSSSSDEDFMFRFLKSRLIAHLVSEFKESFKYIPKKVSLKDEFESDFEYYEFSKDLEDVNNFDDYLFELAFEKGNLRVAQWFLQHGCFINKLYKNKTAGYPSQRYETLPLIAAVENERIAVVKLLLREGANPNKRVCKKMACGHGSGPGNPFICKNDGKALTIAAFRGNIPLVHMLLDAGAKLERDTMRAAVSGGSLDMVKALYKLGWNNGDDWRNIRIAVRGGNTELVKFIFENSTEEFKKDLPTDYWGFNYATLLVDSIEMNNPEITHILLDARPDFNINFASNRSPYGSPLRTAIRKNNLGMARALIKRGACINPPIKDEYGRDWFQSYESNFLYEAAFDDNIEAVKLLLEQGADPTHLVVARYPGVLFPQPRPVIEFIQISDRRPNSEQIVQLLREYASK